MTAGIGRLTAREVDALLVFAAPVPAPTPPVQHRITLDNPPPAAPQRLAESTTSMLGAPVRAAYMYCEREAAAAAPVTLRALLDGDSPPVRAPPPVFVLTLEDMVVRSLSSAQGVRPCFVGVIVVAVWGPYLVSVHSQKF